MPHTACRVAFRVLDWYSSAQEAAVHDAIAEWHAAFDQSEERHSRAGREMPPAELSARCGDVSRVVWQALEAVNLEAGEPP